MPEIDWGFIEACEGRGKTEGYIPKRNGKIMGKSGVTIGSGFDIGQHDNAEIDHLEIAGDQKNVAEVKKKLKFFTHKKTTDAVNALKDYKTKFGQDFSLTDDVWPAPSAGGEPVAPGDPGAGEEPERARHECRWRQHDTD
jgi:hypothetical protein